MSLDLAMSVARSGLRLLDRQMARTADDIANAGTEGHNRRILQGEALSANAVGIGVRAQPLQRDVDLALQAAEMRTRSDAAAAGLRIDLLSGIESVHGGPESANSLSTMLANLRANLITLREMPEDQITRGAVVNAAQDLVGRYHAIADAISTARQSAHDTLIAEAAAANTALAEIGQLNLAIRREVAAGRSAVDLEDKRDLAVGRLSETLDLSVLRNSNGEITVVARGGIVLPTSGEQVFSVAPAAVGATSYHGGAGTLPGVMLLGQDITRQLRGGRMAAAAELRDMTLPRMAAELDLSAAHTAARFEAQGLRLFTDGAGTVPDVTQPYATSGQLGFAARIVVNPAVAANALLVRDGTHVAGGVPVGQAGFATRVERLIDHTFGLNAGPGTPHPPFATSGLGPDGTLVTMIPALLTLEGHGSALVATHVDAHSLAGEARERAGALREVFQDRIRLRSGVDVDREVAAMVELQNAYTVNARVIATVQSLFDVLFGAVR